MDKIVVVGGGGHAKVLISILKKMKAYEIIGYTDIKNKGNILDVSYLGNDDILSELIKRQKHCSAAIGVGSVNLSEERKRIKNLVESLGFDLPAIVSPNAILNEDVSIGKATVVFDGVVVNSGTRIGECSIINTNSTVEHDCEIGDYVHIAPGATLSGGVKVGNNSFIGTGANIIQSKSICENCFIGAGSTVVENCLTRGTYAGIPAKKVK